MDLESTVDKPIIAKNEGLEQVEAALMNRPQVPCPVSHYFGPGVYVRMVTFPPGVMAVSNIHKVPCLNIVLKGKMALVNLEEDKVEEISANTIFVSPPGQKMGYTIEETVWLNIFATDETDVEKLEEMLFEPDETGQEYLRRAKTQERENREADREDFRQLLAQLNLTEEEVRQETEGTADQIKMPDPWSVAVIVRESQIQGKGVFSSWPIQKDGIVAPLRINGKRTPAGRYTNHSKNPTCSVSFLENGDIYLVAKRLIHGCIGGLPGEEITIDYRDILKYSKYKELL